MDNAEEQQMEVEAMEAIYMNDFSLISTAPTSYKVYLEPNQGAGDDENHVALYLTVSYPEAYPQVIPEMTLEVKKGLAEIQVQELYEIITNEANENIGMAMVFTIAEKIKEWLVANNIKGSDGSMHGAMLLRMEQKKKAAEAAQIAKEEAQVVLSLEDQEEERRKQRLRDGTAVTPASFATWKAAFDAEMKEMRLAETGAMGGFAAAALVASEEAALNRKPTGRELFEGNMANAAEELDEEGDEEKKEEGGMELQEATDDLQVDEELFGQEDDADLDELLESDEENC